MSEPRRCHVCTDRMAKHHGQQTGWGMSTADEGRLFVCSLYCLDALNNVPPSDRRARTRLRLRLLPVAEATRVTAPLSEPEAAPACLICDRPNVPHCCACGSTQGCPCPKPAPLPPHEPSDEDPVVGAWWEIHGAMQGRGVSRAMSEVVFPILRAFEARTRQDERERAARDGDAARKALVNEGATIMETLAVDRVLLAIRGGGK